LYKPDWSIEFSGEHIFTPASSPFLSSYRQVRHLCVHIGKIRQDCVHIGKIRQVCVHIGKIHQVLSSYRQDLPSLSSYRQDTPSFEFLSARFAKFLCSAAARKFIRQVCQSLFILNEFDLSVKEFLTEVGVAPMSSARRYSAT
jgi:hypothetical protein